MGIAETLPSRLLLPRLPFARRANIARLLAPRHIAFVGGGSAELALASLREHGYAGEAFVVHPTREEIGGLRCHPSLSALPVAQKQSVGALLPDYGHVSNPLDFTAGYWGNEALLTPMFTAMPEGEYDCGVMVMDHPAPKVSPGLSPAIGSMVKALARAGKATGKPVFMASVNPESIPDHLRVWMGEEEGGAA